MSQYAWRSIFFLRMFPVFVRWLCSRSALTQSACSFLLCLADDIFLLFIIIISFSSLHIPDVCIHFLTDLNSFIFTHFCVMYKIGFYLSVPWAPNFGSGRNGTSRLSCCSTIYFLKGTFPYCPLLISISPSVLLDIQHTYRNTWSIHIRFQILIILLLRLMEGKCRSS